MGYFDGLTTNLFRSTEDGMRVYTPLGRWGRVYRVHPSDEARITREWRYAFVATLATVVAAGLVLQSGARLLWLVFPAILLSIAWARWTARGLEDSGREYTGLRPVALRTRIDDQARALGKRTAWLLLINATLLTAASLWGALTIGQWMFWFGTVFFGLGLLISIRHVWTLRG